MKGRPAPLCRTLESLVPEVLAEIVTDASPWGIGGTLKVGGHTLHYFSSSIPEGALSRFKAQTGLPSLGHGAAVRAKSDNLGVLCMLAKGGAKSPQLNSLAREFALDQALKAYRLHWLEHIPGVTNLEADALSRQTAPNPVAFPEHLKQATRSDVSVGPDFWKVELH